MVCELKRLSTRLLSRKLHYRPRLSTRQGTLSGTLEVRHITGNVIDGIGYSEDSSTLVIVRWLRGGLPRGLCFSFCIGDSHRHNHSRSVDWAGNVDGDRFWSRGAI